MEYYAVVSSGESLEHHGVKGMKWGVRRYQNYDGSYTQAGLERFRRAEKRYDAAESRRKAAAKENAAGGNNRKSYEAVEKARADKSKAKRDMESAYRNIKRAKNADIGRRLYQSGKTIGDNNTRMYYRTAAIIAGTYAAKSILARNVLRMDRRAVYASAAAILGAQIVGSALAVKDIRDNKKLRAYYAYRS